MEARCLLSDCQIDAQLRVFVTSMKWSALVIFMASTCIRRSYFALVSPECAAASWVAAERLGLLEREPVNPRYMNRLYMMKGMIGRSS